MSFKFDENLGQSDFSAASLKQKAYLALQKSILDLEFIPGQLLRKNDLCKRFGISRTPLSEAIALLVQDGLVEVVPQAGTYVARFSMEDLREGAFIREAIEVAAITLLAEIITEPQLIELRRNLRLQRAFIDDGDIQGFSAMDAQFHAILLNSTGYKRLNRVADNAWMNVNRVRRLLLPIKGRLEATFREHKKIYNALEQKNPAKAGKMLKEHLGQLMTFVVPLEQEHPEYFA
jgi:DNA-binding GntR family transcriptional regulator